MSFFFRWRSVPAYSSKPYLEFTVGVCLMCACVCFMGNGSQASEGQWKVLRGLLMPLFDSQGKMNSHSIDV